MPSGFLWDVLDAAAQLSVYITIATAIGYFVCNPERIKLRNRLRWAVIISGGLSVAFIGTAIGWILILPK